MNRIANIEYVGNKGQPIIKISIDDMFTPILVDTEYADTIVIWWNTGSRSSPTRTGPMRVYAIENYDSNNPSINLIDSWDHINILKGLRYAISKVA